MSLVGVVIGSNSDEEISQQVSKVLEDLGIPHEVSVISAHRTPEKAREYAQTAASRGLEIIIAAAGGSAALPGVMASWCNLPIIGIPVPSSELRGVDALYSIAQMPPGVPVACVSIGSWGARNAAYLAASILSLKHEHIKIKYTEYRDKLASS